MNLYDLSQRLRAIEENTDQQLPLAPTVHDAPNTNVTTGDTTGDQLTPECGEMPAAIIGGAPHGQEDHVNMNITINGTGAGGIRDLMDILRNIESDKGSDSVLHSEPHKMDPEEPILSNMVQSMEQDQPMGPGPDHAVGETITGSEDGEKWKNSVDGASGHHTHGIDAVTFSGDDMNSKGKKAPIARVPGSNPLRPVSEELVNKLAKHYQTIKESEGSHSSKRFETDSQRVARMAKEKKQAEKKAQEQK